MKKPGWYRESDRHALASKGIPTKLRANAVTEGETYRFMSMNFDVYEANEIIEDNPRETNKIPVEEWMKMVGDPDEHKIGAVNVDWDYAKELDEDDCSRPGIVILLEDSALLIDGWHRLTACHLNDIEEFPVYVLEPEEAWGISNFEAREQLKPPEDGWDEEKKKILDNEEWWEE